MTQTFLQQLTDLLGSDIVHTKEAEIEPWLTDWRGIYKGCAQAIVRPFTTQQVADCLRLCNEHKVPVVPRGGNTGLCGGATPNDSPMNIIVSLARLKIGRASGMDIGCQYV